MRPHVIAVWEVDSFDYRARMKANYRPYTVVLRDSGTMHCTCEAFRWNQGDHCKHIQLVIDSEPAPIESMPDARYWNILHQLGNVVLEPRKAKQYYMEAEVTISDTAGVQVSNTGAPDLLVSVAPMEGGIKLQVFQYK